MSGNAQNSGPGVSNTRTRIRQAANMVSAEERNEDLEVGDLGFDSDEPRRKKQRRSRSPPRENDKKDRVGKLIFTTEPSPLIRSGRHAKTASTNPSCAFQRTGPLLQSVYPAKLQNGAALGAVVVLVLHRSRHVLPLAMPPPNLKRREAPYRSPRLPFGPTLESQAPTSSRPLHTKPFHRPQSKQTPFRIHIQVWVPSLLIPTSHLRLLLPTACRRLAKRLGPDPFVALVALLPYIRRGRIRNPHLPTKSPLQDLSCTNSP